MTLWQRVVTWRARLRARHQQELAAVSAQLAAVEARREALRQERRRLEWAERLWEHRN